ncbi:MAG: hypothetical protein PHF63_00480 [Herbinix sp.]|nr:hypothetical protein [Herbinix sp.]
MPSFTFSSTHQIEDLYVPNPEKWYIMPTENVSLFLEISDGANSDFLDMQEGIIYRRVDQLIPLKVFLSFYVTLREILKDEEINRMKDSLRTLNYRIESVNLIIGVLEEVDMISALKDIYGFELSRLEEI